MQEYPITECDDKDENGLRSGNTRHHGEQTVMLYTDLYGDDDNSDYSSSLVGSGDYGSDAHETYGSDWTPSF